LKEKEELETNKIKIKEILDQMIDETFREYGLEINTTLNKFGASYKIENLK
jgi:hypothetical protein